MLKFIYGRAATGKTTRLHKEIKNEIENGKKVFLLVPEQNTFETERRMLELFGGGFMASVEVLSFTRLCDKAGQLYGGIAGFKVDDSQRCILMGRALKNTAPHLTVFKKYVSSPSFISQMTSVIKEFKTAGVSDTALMEVAQNSNEGHLKEKLTEIAMVYASYNSLLKGVYIDPLDDLEIFYQKAIDNGFFKGATVYVDAFKTFSGIQMKIIKLMICAADKVVFSLCCEPQGGKQDTGVFANVNSMALRLTEYASEHNVFIDEKVVLTTPYFKSEELVALEKMLADIEEPQAAEKYNDIVIKALETPSKEIDYVFKTIHRLVRTEGYRYGDFVIIARDISKYERRIAISSKKFDVPCFFDKRRKLMSSPVARFVISLVKAAASFNTENIISLLKTGFLPFNDSQINMLEEYCFVWNIDQALWSEEWKMNPNGFKSSLDDYYEFDEVGLEKINEIKKQIVDCLLKVKSAFGKDAETISKTVYEVMNKNKVDDAVKKLCREYLDYGDSETADFVMQSWDRIMELLDSVVRCSGDDCLSAEEYIGILELAFGSATLGALPRMLDEVSCGSADRIRPARPKVVFAIGMNLSEFPKIPEDNGILLRSDRVALSKKEINISDHFKNYTIDENNLVYSALCCATEKVFALCHKYGYNGDSVEESPIFTKLANCFGRSVDDFNPLPETKDEGFEMYSAVGRTDPSIAVALKEILSQDGDYAGRLEALEKVNIQIERRLSPGLCQKLFGSSLSVSPSKLETYKKCPLSYFCRYVLNVNRLQKAELDNIKRGLVVHFVLEKLLSNKDLDIKSAEVEELDSEVERLMEEYLDNVIGFVQIETEFFKFLYSELTRNVKYLVRHLAEQFKNSDFSPVAFEFSIKDKKGNKKGDIPAFNLEFSDGKNVKLDGKIDRVDVYTDAEGRQALRIIDYKTNSKTFNLSDVIFGQNMQMLIYLYVLKKSEHSPFKDMDAAGILYMPSKRGITTGSSGNPLMMNGMILDDADILRAMDKDGGGKFVFKKSEKGRKDNPVISNEDFETVFAYLEKTVMDTSAKIFNGEFDLVPTDGADVRKDNACKYCDYKTVCKIEKDFVHNRVESYYPDEILKIMKEAVKNELD